MHETRAFDERKESIPMNGKRARERERERKKEGNQRRKGSVGMTQMNATIWGGKGDRRVGGSFPLTKVQASP